MEWISVDDRLPKYNTKVIVLRPNMGNASEEWIDMAYLHKSKMCGQKYGRSDEWDKITYEDYWSFPGISPKNSVSHWMPLPKPPNQ